MKRILKSMESKFRGCPEVRERVTSHAPENNVTTPNDAVSDHSATVPTLTTLGKSFDVIESTGFDPYNSGSFESSKSRSYK